MTQEKPTNNKNLGEQGVKIENNNYVVSVTWKDGMKSESHFPEKGFEVFDPKTKDRLGFISGEKAISILKEHSSKYNLEDFSWIPFLNK